MSTPAILLSVYFLVGLLLMSFAMVSRGKEKRGRDFDFVTGEVTAAWLLVFIALLWPIWLIALISRKDT